MGIVVIILAGGLLLVLAYGNNTQTNSTDSHTTTISKTENTTQKINSKTNSFGSVVIDRIEPHLGQAGTRVFIIGSGFTPTGNKIKFGDLSTENNPNYNLDSSDNDVNVPNQKRIVFTIPSVPPGAYAISVTNANGTSQEQLEFIVTSYQPLPAQ